MAAVTSMSASVLAASSFSGAAVESRTTLAGSSLPSLALAPSSRSAKAGRLSISASGGKKIKVSKPLGLSGDSKYRGGVDASGSKEKGKGVYQFVKKYGANVDGYSPIWDPESWAESGDSYAGGTQGLLLWAVTLGAVVIGGALLIVNTSALS